MPPAGKHIRENERSYHAVVWKCFLSADGRRDRLVHAQEANTRVRTNMLRSLHVHQHGYVQLRKHETDIFESLTAYSVLVHFPSMHVHSVVIMMKTLVIMYVMPTPNTVMVHEEADFKLD